MNKRELLKIMSATALTVVLAGAGTPSIASDKVDISFRLDWSIYGTHAPFYLALQSGLYEKAGLNVTIGEGQGSPTVAKLIAQGNDPIGFVDFGTMARSVEQGMPLKAVMRIMSDVTCMISHADAPIKNPKELEGKVVAFGPSESTGQIFPALLASENVDPAQVSILNPATGAKNAIFLQRRADAIPGHYSVQVAQLEDKGAKLHYFKFSDYGVSQMNNGIIVNTDFLAKNPEAVRGFLKATAEAFEIASKDPKIAVDALIEALPEQARNRKVFERQLELTAEALTTKNTQGKPFGTMDVRDWDDTQKLLVEYAGLPRALPSEELFTNDFLPKQ